MIEFLGWVFLLIVLIGVGIAAGVLLADWLEDQRRKVLDAREAKLQAEWRSLLAAQRLQAEFMEARRAMWDEAVRQHHRRPGES